MRTRLCLCRQIECAVPVLLPSLDLPGVGMQHLWVCSSDVTRGQVTVVSLHDNQPHVVESFKVRQCHRHYRRRVVNVRVRASLSSFSS